MQFGLAAWGLREESLESQLAMAKKLGVDLLEFSIANYSKDIQLDVTKEELDAIKAAFEKYGIRLECGCTGNDFGGDDPTDQIEKVKAVIDIAAYLGIKYLRIFASFCSDKVIIGDKFVSMCNALKCVNDYAKTKNITLCVETHGGVSSVGNGAIVHTCSPSTRVDYLKEIVKTGVSINYDPANLSAVGVTSVTAFYEIFKDYIPYVHLKDFFDVPGGVVPSYCGRGRLNYDEVMAALKNYDGPVLIEYELVEDVEDGMRKSLDFLRKYL